MTKLKYNVYLMSIFKRTSNTCF